MLHYSVISVIIAVLVRDGLAIMCYECVDFLEEDCGEDFESDNIDKVECDSRYDLCMIHKSPPVLRVPEIIQRGCVDQYYCSKVDEYEEHCITCDEDLCNKAFSVTSSCTLLVIVYIVRRFAINLRLPYV
ncbi:hypothetical protein PPYR_12522 [Photinus pyralis]|uniref:Uncharacterized protein n=1 Tax=Photinus pyralis TaxID=7054 RepID=A0A5N4A6F7_PHOPY|nr:hypothetical protein PPYR_12522 [Photinus pyralis]